MKPISTFLRVLSILIPNLALGEIKINPPRSKSTETTYNLFSPGKLSSTPTVLLNFVTLPSSKSHVRTIQKTGGKMIEREFSRKIFDHKVTCYFTANPHEKIFCNITLQNRRGSEVCFVFPDVSKDTMLIVLPEMSESDFLKLTLLYKYVLTELVWANVLEMKLPRSRKLSDVTTLKDDRSNQIGKIILSGTGARSLSGSNFFSRTTDL